MNFLGGSKNMALIAKFISILSVLIVSLVIVLPIVVKDTFAITAEEMLEDPVLEKRARDISAKLRCLVCQNQSIDDSDSELAIDLRKQVRAYLKQDMTDKAIFQALKDKYGEFVLLSPPFQPATLLLWGAPLVILSIGIFLIANVFLPFKNKAFGNHKSQNVNRIESKAQSPSEKMRNANTSGKPDTQIPAIIKIILPVLSLIITVAIYLVLGSPNLNDQPIANRGAIRVAAEINSEAKQNLALSSFKQAKENAEKNPNSLSAQFLLAATASQIGLFEDEIDALRKSLLLSGNDTRIKSQLAEALTRQTNGQVTKEASKLISQVLQTNPKDIRALYLRGLEESQKGDFKDAIMTWQTAAKLILPSSPLANVIRSDVAMASKSLGVELAEIVFADSSNIKLTDSESEDALIDVEGTLFEERQAQFSNLSEMEQTQFIQQMVKRLSDRLEEQPDNFYGWLQLANAHISTEDFISASNALRNAAETINSDKQRVTLIEFVLLSHPSHSLTQLVEHQFSKLPDSLKQSNSIKFLEGELWRQIGDNRKAVRLWEDILDQIPADSQQGKKLQQYITELQKNL